LQYNGSFTQNQPVVYQWYFNGNPISTATASTYTVPNVQVSNSGGYVCVATMANVTYASTSGILTVPNVNQPIVIVNPVSRSVRSGSYTTFYVLASGSNISKTNATSTSRATTKASSGISYQWYFDGMIITGATDSTYVTTASKATTGYYECLVQNTSGSVLSSAAVLTLSESTNLGRLTNISTLGFDGAGRLLTLGFINGGPGTSGPESLLVRATGPALAPYQVTNLLKDPTLTFYSGNNIIAQNSGWASTSTNQILVTAADALTGAFVLTNPNSTDSATLVNVTPGPYTVQVNSKSGLTGNALAEIYDATPVGSFTLATPRILNLSCLQKTATNETLTQGFVLGGDSSETVLVRAIGPGLIPYGVTGVMADPQLTVYDSKSNIIGFNFGWGGSSDIIKANSYTGAFPLNNYSSADSAIILTLNPGAYTIKANSASGSGGSVLIEVYEMR
jgi:hypothetical protein